MTKKTKNTKTNTNTYSLLEEKNYLIEQVSELNEHINTMEQEAEDRNGVIRTLVINNLTLQDLLTKQASQSEVLEDSVTILYEENEALSARVEELEQDNLHLTMQRDALKEKGRGRG